MGRPSGSKNKHQSGISYPRKCNHCDYVSNNPQMWHYHNKTHDSIPKDKLCDQGCGNPALFRNTGGKYTCTKVTQHCPEYIKQHSERVKSQWQTAAERKESTRKSFIERLHNRETIEKQIKTRRKKFGTLDPKRAKDFRHYARYVRERAQKWAKENGYVLGKQTFHVDHKLSIIDAFNNNLPENIVNHPANLQILEAKKNSSKGSKSILTVNELYDMIKKYEHGN